MKRTRYRWVPGVLTSLLMLVLMQARETEAARATSLIFSKATSTTTTPTPPTPSDPPAAVEQEAPTAADGEETNSTSKLSGIPQLDYIYDPNLPRELNGYNLSQYPFYATVPKLETIDFKCDGLHDGFYASVKHKCQVYHHCIHGIRYDFLCANYTAFDQKTFICQFVSEVDCKNSINFWGRNDALYKATTTSTAAPPPTTTTAPPPPRPPQRPRGHRPLYRHYDYDDDEYYTSAAGRDDDYYDYRDSRRRPRPRPKQRPGANRRPYDDRYNRRPRPRDDEADEEYEDRRSQERTRGSKRPDRYYPDERRHYDDDEEDRVPPRRKLADREGPSEDRESRRPYRPRNERPLEDEDDIKDDRNRDDVGSRDEVRSRDEGNSRDETISRDEMRPRDEVRPRDETRPREEIRPKDEGRYRDENNKPRDERTRDEYRPREEKRPRDEPRYRDDPRDDRSEGRRHRDPRPYRSKERPYDEDEDQEDRRSDSGSTATDDPKPLVIPNGPSLYSKPRVAPKIRRPVPVNVRQKYDYISTTKPSSKTEETEEYYDEYEDDDNSKPSPSGRTSSITSKPKPEKVEKETFVPTNPAPKRSHSITASNSKPKRPNTVTRKPIEYDDEEYEDVPSSKPKRRPLGAQRTKNESKPKPLDNIEYEDYEQERPSKVEDRRSLNTESKPKAIDYSNKSNPRNYLNNQRDIAKATVDNQREVSRAAEKLVQDMPKDRTNNFKVVKRPFLPSRGGSPYLPRGLQPLGGKHFNITSTTTSKPKATTAETKVYDDDCEEDCIYDSYEENENPEDVKTPESVQVTTNLNIPKAELTTVAQNEGRGTFKYDITDPYKGKEVEPHKETPLTTAKPDITTAEIQKPVKEYPITAYQKPANDYYKADDYQKPDYKTVNDYQKPRPDAKLTTPIFKPLLNTVPPELNPVISKHYPATSKPPQIPENISIKQNLADSIESDYDVTLNEALTPTSPNTAQIRNFPTGFIVPADRDYTFSRFRSNYHNAEPILAASELSNYQLRQRPIQNVNGVSIRTPQSYFLQPNAQYSQEDGSHRFPRTLVYRHVNLGDFI